ncbi:hypothetical protein, partial [Salmonella enterica]|uniref:hypothetical protein n=1 Tax=Salmonella enterica TaxID=28901 RepID=UPI003CE7DB42
MADMQSIIKRFEKRLEICTFAVEWLFHQTQFSTEENSKKKGVQFSVVELLNDLKKHGQSLFISLDDVQL